MNGRTKKINGVQCNSSSFAWVGDEENCATWLLPLWIPGDAKKSLNAVKTSLYHFDNAKIPDAHRQQVFDTLRGASLAHGLKIEHRTFAVSSDASTAASEPPTPVVKQKPVAKDSRIEDAVSLADFRASEMLRAMGLD